MSRVVPLIALGFGLITAGAFWMFIDQSLPYLDRFVINDEYFQLINLGWDAMPLIVLLCGILSLISAGVLASREHMVVDN